MNRNHYNKNDYSSLREQRSVVSLTSMPLMNFGGPRGHDRITNKNSQLNARMPVKGKIHKPEQKKETVQLEGGGEIKINLPKGSTPNVVDDNKMKVIDKEMKKSAATRHRAVKPKNVRADAKLKNNTGRSMVFENGPAPKDLPNGAHVTMKNANGAPNLSGKSATITMNNASLDGLQAHNTALNIKAVGTNNTMRNANVGYKSFISGYGLDAVTGSHLDAGHGNLKLGAGAQAAGATLSGNVDVAPEMKQKAALNALHLATDSEAPKSVGPFLTVVHESRKAFEEARKPGGAMNPIPNLSVGRKREMQLAA